MAAALSERAQRTFQPETDPLGVGAASAAALSAELRTFAEAFAAAVADPRNEAWLTVARALNRIHRRSRESDSGDLLSSPRAFAYANLSLALAAYYVEGCSPSGMRLGRLCRRASLLWRRASIQRRLRAFAPN